MADVMSDLSSSNGELKDDNDDIRINGDNSDGAVESIENPSLDEARITKKIITDVNPVDKLHDIKEKNPMTIANGHLKSDSCETKSKSLCNNENKDLSDFETSAVNESSSNEQNEDSSAVLENDEENGDDDDVDDIDDCDSGPLNFAQNKRSDENDVLNLKKSNNSHEKHELRTADDKTESLTAEDGSHKSEADHLGDSDQKSTDDKDDDALSSDSPSDKSNKKIKKPLQMINVTPRRSSRNLNKQKSYAEKEAEYEEDDASGAKSKTHHLLPSQQEPPPQPQRHHEDDEIEEVTPTDPLADDPKLRIRPNKTIVVSDTKGLVEFASSAKMPRSNKKEPTLVIIDTNSILSGRGPVPISQSPNVSNLHSSSVSAPIPVSLPIPAGALANATRGVPASTSAFSVIPIGIPPQNMYSQYKPPPQMKPIVVGPASTTVTPISIQSVTSNVSNGPPQSNAPSNKQPPIILPSLTDDMFVVEAPSFIVPYVYEKPPMKSLKDYIDKLGVEVREAEEKERLEREEKERIERDEREKAEKERLEKEAEERKKEQEAIAEKGDNDKEAKDESMELDESKTEKSSVSDESIEDGNKQPSEKDTTLQMEVDEEVDPNAPKVTSETDVVLASSKKSDPVKKEETIAITPVAKDEKKLDDLKKPISYFDNPLGKFFMQIGLNLVQEHVQTDLLRSQKRKRDKEGDKCPSDVKLAIETLTKTLESSKENNDPFKLELKKCELCSFKTESILVMAHHLETPHMKNYTYRCNFCPFEVRSPHDILYHMESEHNVRGRLERAPAFHQCPNCPFEDNQKGKLTRHMVSCSKKYRPERNQEPPLDWEPPAKIPRVTRNRPPSMSPGNAVYQAAMSGLKQAPQNTLLPKLMPTNAANMKQPNMMNMNKRPNPVPSNYVHRFPNAANQPTFQQRPISVQSANQAIMYRSPVTNSQSQVIIPQNYQLPGAQIYQQTQNLKQQNQIQQGLAAAKLLNQPSISITPLPRQTTNTHPSTSSSNPGHVNMKPGKPPGPGSKNSFVVCEICDSNIKDLEQLRNHMQWIHKVKIHPKMIYNRPPLNCQKCQFRFFTDQGLERHLLGSHGLVTSSMQEAANKGKDSGRCPVCGRVYQWKLLNHVARDHQMALKPAHLSYKCTVCTATFGMYKQFESHVYSAHSVVAKRAMDTKKPPVIPPPSSSSQNDALLKPLKINDEITIIPQPVRSSKPPNKPPSSNSSASIVQKGKDPDDDICTEACVPTLFASDDEYRQHLWQQHARPCVVRLPRLNVDELEQQQKELRRQSPCIENVAFREIVGEKWPSPQPPTPTQRRPLSLSSVDNAILERFCVRECRVELVNYSCLSGDFVYQIVERDADPNLLVPVTQLVAAFETDDVVDNNRSDRCFVIDGAAAGLCPPPSSAAIAIAAASASTCQPFYKRPDSNTQSCPPVSAAAAAVAGVDDGMGRVAVHQLKNNMIDVSLVSHFLLGAQPRSSTPRSSTPRPTGSWPKTVVRHRSADQRKIAQYLSQAASIRRGLSTRVCSPFDSRARFRGPGSAAKTFVARTPLRPRPPPPPPPVQPQQQNPSSRVASANVMAGDRSSSAKTVPVSLNADIVKKQSVSQQYPFTFVVTTTTTAMMTTMASTTTVQKTATSVNQFVTSKRVPLSLRQPPYANVEPARFKRTDIIGGSATLGVQASFNRTQSVGPMETIDLLSDTDDENEKQQLRLGSDGGEIIDLVD